MKYVFVGDVHGKVECVEAALAKDGKKIFVGDFIDSYDRTTEDHKDCYDLVFDAIEKGEAEAIFGNHELSYILPHKHRCSGWSPERQLLMTHYGPTITKLFKPYIFLKPDLLVSHAGICNTLWEDEMLTMENMERVLQDWWPDVSSAMHYIGKYRGGSAPYGGLFWCDFNVEFDPVPGLNQIFGHTRGKGLRQNDNAWCIDALDYGNEFLELDL